MKLIIYSSNFSPELTGIGKFNGEMAGYFSRKGIETHVVSAPPYYPEWKRHSQYLNFWTKTNQKDGVTVHRSPMYVPKQVSLCKRLLHLMSFALSSLPNLFKFLLSRPDVVMVVQPSFFCAPATLVFCALTGARSVMHIQDFELDAMLGLGMSGGCKRWAIFRRLETFILRRFDAVSSISYSMLEKARTKGVDSERLLYFPNWIDTSTVKPDVNGELLKESWGIASHKKVVLYSGNLGNKQGLELVLETAEQLQDKQEIEFVIVGSGTAETCLKELAEAKGLKNVQFKPLQPFKLLPQMLAMADVHLVVQRKGVADAVLPSKLTAILAAGGHALVTAEDKTELGQISRRFPGVYSVVEPECLESFRAALEKCLAMDTKTANQVARKYALNHLKMETVIDQYIADLQLVVAGSSAAYSDSDITRKENAK